MSKRGKREPDLIVEESIDEKTGAKVVRKRRGMLISETRSLNGDASIDAIKELWSVGGKGLRQEFQGTREKLCDYLELNGLPCSRTPVLVSVKGAPFRPERETDTLEFMVENAPVELRRWDSLAAEKTEPLSADRACIEYLAQIDRVLAAFDDQQLHIMNSYAWAFFKFRMAAGGINVAAAEGLRAAKGNKTGGRMSAEARRAKAEAGWRRHALELAQQIQAEPAGESLSQDKMANEIDSRWKDANNKQPGHATLKALVSAKIAAGELLKRKTVK